MNKDSLATAAPGPAFALPCTGCGSGPCHDAADYGPWCPIYKSDRQGIGRRIDELEGQIITAENEAALALFGAEAKDVEEHDRGLDGLRRELTWLRELRARRIAMDREPDDERNAAADMCCCRGLPRGVPVAVFRDGCPMHPGPAVVIGPLLRCGAWRLADCDYLGRVTRNGGLEESDCALCDVAGQWRAP